MTEKLFDDGLLFEFEARVISCEGSEKGFAVILDRSAFFPEGGGQYADTGSLGGARVLDVRDIDGETVHFTDKPLPVGETVHGTVDRDIRLRRMQEHSGEHLLTGIIHNRYGFNNVGFHLGREGVTLDLDGKLTAQQILECEHSANKAVSEDRKITVSYPDSSVLGGLIYRSKLDISENVRIVTIEGIDRCACCAPHMKSTGGIGIIKVISSESYKGGTRLRLLCGLDALDDYNARLESIYSVSHLLSAKPERIAESARRLSEEHGRLKAELSRIGRERADRLISSLKQVQGSLCVFTESMSAADMNRIANAGVKLTGGAFGIFSKSRDGYSYIIASDSIDMLQRADDINRELSGKGGGTSKMIRGNVSASEKAVRSFFKTRL